MVLWASFHMKNESFHQCTLKENQCLKNFPSMTSQGLKLADLNCVFPIIHIQFWQLGVKSWADKLIFEGALRNIENTAGKAAWLKQIHKWEIPCVGIGKRNLSCSGRRGQGWLVTGVYGWATWGELFVRIQMNPGISCNWGDDVHIPHGVYVPEEVWKMSDFHLIMGIL